MKRILFHLPAAALIAIFACGAAAQDKPKLECPATRVHSSAEAVTDGETLMFHVELIGGNVDRSILEYYWTVDRGRIVDGQGTPVVTVDTKGVGSAGSVTATVTMFPYRECCWASSETAYVRRKGPRTNADMFWEWLWFNSLKLQYAELPENAGIAREIRERLDQIDPKLTLELGPKGDDGKREIIVGHTGKPYDSKAVADFVARAPNLVVFSIVFKNTSIHHPRQ